ncbi:MAG: lysozyme inhibitor LprI family protein, partial [Pseudomonadota bacterium]
AEQAMQIMLDAALAQATELDEITGREVAVPALLASQAAWEAFREAECDYAGALFGGGSGTGIGITSCRIELTRARTRELTSRL